MLVVGSWFILAWFVTINFVWILCGLLVAVAVSYAIDRHLDRDSN